MAIARPSGLTDEDMVHSSEREGSEIARKGRSQGEMTASKPFVPPKGSKVSKDLPGPDLVRPLINVLPGLMTLLTAFLAP